MRSGMAGRGATGLGKAVHGEVFGKVGKGEV